MMIQASPVSGVYQKKEVNKMAKAKYIGKYHGTGYDRNNIYLEYEYRGMTYTVMENKAKGNEPLSWQHKSEQALIDKILDTPEQKESHPFDINEIYKILEWD